MDKIKAIQRHLETWLERHRRETEIAPAVQEMLEITEWEVETLETLPAGDTNIDARRLQDDAAIDLDLVESLLPLTLQYPSSTSFEVNSLVTPLASGIVSIMSDISHSGTPAAVSYATDRLREYQALQDRQRRPQRVRDLVAEQLQEVLTKFDLAQHVYGQWKAGTTSRTAVAFSIRTLLDATKGALFEQARTKPKENMTWETMANRLFKSSTTAHRQILRQKKHRAALVDELSRIGKQREGSSKLDLEGLWQRSLDHLFTVTNLMKSRDT